MSNFTDVIDNLVSTLSQNAGLVAFCQDIWGKNPSVQNVYKPRVEIHTNDLPVILITRPQKESSDYPIGSRRHFHTVNLYAGFHEPDRSKAQAELIKLDEYIEAALLVDRSRGGFAQNTEPLNTVNDEGTYHPVYFMAMQVKIETRY